MSDSNTSQIAGENKEDQKGLFFSRRRRRRSSIDTNDDRETYPNNYGPAEGGLDYNEIDLGVDDPKS